MSSPGIGRWSGRVALVTGAGSGIGLFTAEKLVSVGITVVGCARNVGPIEKLRDHCKVSGFGGNLHPYKCDLRKDSEIDDMFKWINDALGGVDICINNAGFTTGTSLMEIPPKEMRDMLDTNIVALVYCTQSAVKSMIERKVNDGHIINVNSILGHSVLGIFNFYSSTKFAVTALTQGFRKELVEKNLRIKVSSISPGRTETRFLNNVFGPEKAQDVYSSMENLKPEDVAESILHVLASPPHVQIAELMIEPIQPSNSSTYPKK